MNTKLILLLGAIAKKESGNSFIKQVNKIVFNLDYHPAFKNVGAIIRKHLPILNKSACIKEIFDSNNTRILTGFRRYKNLKEVLLLLLNIIIKPSIFSQHT